MTEQYSQTYLEQKLKQVFGFDGFRDGQLEIVRHLLDGLDLLSVMPTGAGKSLCFQLPALIQNFKTVVISPLVALMDDQAAALQDLGVKVALIHSGRTYADNANSWRSFAAGEAKILYLSPERLMQERMLAALGAQQIGMFVIDEAHCISKWGAGFRPDYEALSRLKDVFPNAVIAAFTATADQATRADISEKLTKGRGLIIVKGFDRPNLSLAVAPKHDLKKSLLAYVKSRAGQCGIIYCLSRKETDEVAAHLTAAGINAIAYHAGKTPEFRTAAQNRFMSEDAVVMVATIAFGMGIDKPDIRFVVHASLPTSVEAFYQEIGRAGRDGLPAETTLFYGLADLIKRQRMIFEGDGNEHFKLLEYKRLEALIGYCETVKCRKSALLAYFDEDSEACGNCDNCLNPPVEEDYSAEARLVIEAIEGSGQFFGASHIIDIIRGAQTAKIREKRHDALAVFGAGHARPKGFFQGLIRQLISSGMLRVNLEKYGAVQLTAKADDLRRGRASFFARVNVSTPLPRQSRAGRSNGAGGDIGADVGTSSSPLFQALKAVRLEFAMKKKVPAFVIFPDATLMEMAQQQPLTEADFLAINGVGPKKIEAYYAAFSAVIDAHITATPTDDNRLEDGA
ncbi:DNA helicase RecQ [Alphaproteobacteria bacterium]|nr:DNA helicase RecQ [Alphaproteobacteria bacterium]